LVNVAEAASSQLARIDIAPSTFRNIEPGVTTLKQLITAWGEPAQKSGQAEELVLLYNSPPFSAIQVHATAEVVTSILIRLEDKQLPESLAKRLQLDFIRTVEVRDEQGRPLGLAFPERGVLFGYHPSAAVPQVAQVLLETIDPQAFYLRAESNWRSAAAASLDDLNYVVEQNPGDAAAQHLRARIYLSLGQIDRAVAAVNRARELDSEEFEYRLTRAECLLQLGQNEEAEAEALAVRSADTANAVSKGRALVLLGNLLAAGSRQDFKAAIALHMEAIKLVEPLANDPLVATRRKAKEVLLAATLAVAHDVAWGNWNRKEEVVPKWIEKADAYAREAIERDGAGVELRLMVIERALAAHTGFKPAIEPAHFLEVAEELTKSLTDATKDPLAQQAAEWELGRIYNRAVRLAHLRGTVDAGFQYGEIAQEKLENAAAGRGSSLQARNELGRLYFNLGVLYAVHRQNHVKAVQWYERAHDLLLTEERRSIEDPGQLGEMLISMGVSYWQADLKQQGLELTTQGTNLVKEAVEQGSLAADSLLVPYGNLASMHEELGHREEAREFNFTAQKLERSQLK
jgi:tetratricopeptide (TPR) repeat protein